MIDSILKQYKTLIDNRIDTLYPESREKFAKVIDASRYSLLLGGKRIRPILMLEFCRLCGGEIDDALDFAVALEFIHTYSLIHDDLPCMDNDDMRRGHPSCHVAYGEDIALLAGDALLTEAFSIAAKANVPSDRCVKAISVLAENSGVNGMLGGQVIDLSFVGNSPDEADLTEMYSKKTGCLLVSAAKIGCILAGANEEEIKNAASYAENVGLAFQVIDDILDAVGEEEVLGKRIGSDQKNAKTTFITIHGVEKSREIAKKLTDKALDALDYFKGDTQNLKAITEFLLKRNY